MWRPNTTTPTVSTTTSCTITIAMRGIALPSTISGDVAGLDRTRSHVLNAYSEKNANVVSDTMKNAFITAWPGTTCSAPFACG